MHIFNLAIALEKEIESFYNKLAQESDSAGLKKIFLQLAMDEKKHRETIAALSRGVAEEPMSPSVLLVEAEDLFQLLVDEKPSFNLPKDVLEAYRYAMNVEADSSRLYRHAAEKEKNPETKKILLKIAAEEEKHFALVENLYNFVNAPNEYLAWREFSNIDEYTNFGRDVDI